MLALIFLPGLWEISVFPRFLPTDTGNLLLNRHDVHGQIFQSLTRDDFATVKVQQTIICPLFLLIGQDDPHIVAEKMKHEKQGFVQSGPLRFESSTRSQPLGQ